MSADTTPTFTLSINVHGGVAYLNYNGPTTLTPGDALMVEIHDYDVDDDHTLPRDQHGSPYALGDSLSITISPPID